MFGELQNEEGGSRCVYSTMVLTELVGGPIAPCI